MATETDQRLDEQTSRGGTDDGDHDRMSHIVIPKSAVMEAMVTGTPCTALCGKRWVPSRDPKNYPVCPTCKEIVEAAGHSVPQQ
jgi:hypothetical protein